MMNSRYGVQIGQVINFQDARVTIVAAYPGQVRCKFEQLDGAGLFTGNSRTKSVPRAEYDKWMETAKPVGSPKAEVETDPVPGRKVKIMRVSPSGDPNVLFEDASFEEVEAGDVFIVIEPDGTEAPGGPWLARSDAHWTTDGWTIDCDPLDLETPEVGDPDLVV